MNKTTEALMLAAKALGCSQQHLDLYNPEWVFTRQQNDKALAAIREALVEPEITTPDVCGEVCARAKLCYGCGKALDEANAKLADHVEQSLTMVAEPKCSEHPDAPHGFDRNASHNAGRYVCECEGWEPDEPVKQEPVKLIEKTKMKPIAYLVDGELRVDAEYSGKIYFSEKPLYDEVDVRQDERTKLMSIELTDDDILEADKHSHGNTEWVKKKAFSHALINAFKHKNAAPVDAKAIRAEALEEAAKVCEEEAKAWARLNAQDEEGFGAIQCAAAIRARSLK